MKQHVEILFIRMQTCTNGAQALATLTPAGQLGTPEGFCLIDGEDSVTKVGSSARLIKFKFHFKGFFQLNSAQNNGIMSLPVTFQ